MFLVVLALLGSPPPLLWEQVFQCTMTTSNSGTRLPREAFRLLRRAASYAVPRWGGKGWQGESSRQICFVLASGEQGKGEGGILRGQGKADLRGGEGGKGGTDLRGEGGNRS